MEGGEKGLKIQSCGWKVERKGSRYSSVDGRWRERARDIVLWMEVEEKVSRYSSVDGRWKERAQDIVLWMVGGEKGLEI
jgi:hypothetical protein